MRWTNSVSERPRLDSLVNLTHALAQCSLSSSHASVDHDCHLENAHLLKKLQHSILPFQSWLTVKFSHVPAVQMGSSFRRDGAILPLEAQNSACYSESLIERREGFECLLEHIDPNVTLSECGFEALEPLITLHPQ